MRTIHKHRLDLISEVQELRLPDEAVVRSVDYTLQDRAVMVWVEVDADTIIDEKTGHRRFKVFHTGDGIPDNAAFVGSTLNHLKPEAYHVYELND
jgi:hypothetical protein